VIVALTADDLRERGVSAEKFAELCRSFAPTPSGEGHALARGHRTRVVVSELLIAMDEL